MSATVLPSDNSMRHFCITPYGVAHLAYESNRFIAT
jgi:hypothetical protein